MTFKTKIFIGIALLIFFGLGFFSSLGLRGKFNLEKSQVIYRIDPNNSNLIEKRYFYLTGQVKEIDVKNNNITLSDSSELIKIDLMQDIPVVSYAFPNTQPTNVKLQDVKIGDKVSVYAEAQQGGILLGKNAYIHFVPVQSQ